MEPSAESEVIKDLRQRLQWTEHALESSQKECKLKDQQIEELKQLLANQTISRQKTPPTPTPYEQQKPNVKCVQNEAAKNVDKDVGPNHSKRTSLMGQCSAPITVHSVTRKADAPTEMRRGTSATDGSKCYFIPWGSYHVHEYDVDKDEWVSLSSPYPYRACALTVIKGLLTGVGGIDHKLEPTDVLCTLVEGVWKKGHFPAMLTPRAEPAAVCGRPADFLIVVGGRREVPLAVVEVMDVASMEWTRVAPIPAALKNLSATLCEDYIYVTEGVGSLAFRSKYHSQPALEGWEKVEEISMKESTCSTLCGHLVVLSKRTGDIHAYQPDENSWHPVGQLTSGRSYPFLVQVGWNKVLVVGGGVLEKAGGGSSMAELVTGSVVI